MTHQIAYEPFSHYTINIHGEVFDAEGIRQIPSTYHGYRCYRLTDNERHKRLARICRLLAFTFIPNPNNYNIVEHINHNTLDDRLENLRWNSQSNANLNRDIDYEDRHVETEILYQIPPPHRCYSLDDAPHGARNKRITLNKYFYDFELLHIVYRTRNGFKRLVYTNDDGNRRRCTLTAIDTITNARTKIQIANVDNFLDNIFN